MSCGKDPRNDKEGAAAVVPIVAVKIDSVKAGAIPEMINVTGMTKVLRQENSSSPIEGKVTKLSVFEGDVLKRAQVIATVETKEALAAITGAELLLARAQSVEDKAWAEKMLELAKHNKTTIEIRAPFDGVVVARGLNEGEFVSSGGTIATVIDLRSLYFFARLPVRDLAHVKVGQDATVSFASWPDRHFRAAVENIKPNIDPLAQMAEVRLRFLAAIPELRSEMFGTAEIVVGEHADALLVPDAAVIRDDETGVHTIMEAVGDSLGVVHPVEIGIERPTVIEISGAGIHAGMHIIVEGHYGLPDSTRIQVKKD